SIIVGKRVDPVGLAEPDHLTWKREVDVIRVIAEPVVGLHFRWHARGGGDPRIASVRADDQSSPNLSRLPLLVFGDYTRKAAIVRNQITNGQAWHEIHTLGVGSKIPHHRIKLQAPDVVAERLA